MISFLFTLNHLAKVFFLPFYNLVADLQPVLRSMILTYNHLVELKIMVVRFSHNIFEGWQARVHRMQLRGRSLSKTFGTTLTSIIQVHIFQVTFFLRLQCLLMLLLLENILFADLLLKGLSSLVCASLCPP
jgi:hypothetical protein